MNTLRSLRAALALGAATLLLAGCAPSAEGIAGTWGSDAAGEPLLALGDNGTLSGTDGCNRLTGSWALTGDGTLEFGDIAMTEMACENVDTWLSGLATGEVAGGKLHIFDGTGKEIGSLAHERETELR